MPQDSGADDATDLRWQAGQPRRPGTPPPGRPPRPAMSDVTPAPVPRPIPPTRTVTAARTLWIVSLALGLPVVIFAVLNREDRIAHVVELVTALQPGRAAETIGSVAALVFWGTVGALAAMILIEALLVRAMLRRHGRVRIALLVAVVMHIGVAVLADAFALLVTAEGTYSRLVLVAQLVLAVAAVVAGFLPGAAAWFMAGRAARR